MHDQPATSARPGRGPDAPDRPSTGSDGVAVLTRYCSTRQRRIVERHLQRLDVAAGTTLIRSGERSNSFLVLVSGTARSGSRVLGPGDHLGVVELLLDEAAVDDVITSSDAIVGALPPRMFHVLIRDLPPLARAVMTDLARATRT